MYYLIIATIIIFVLVIIRKERHSKDFNGTDYINGYTPKGFLKKLSVYFEGNSKISGFDWGFPGIRGSKEGFELNIILFDQFIQIEILFPEMLAFPCSFLHLSPEDSPSDFKKVHFQSHEEFHNYYIESDNRLFGCEINTPSVKKRLTNLCHRLSRLEIQSISLEADLPIQELMVSQFKDTLEIMKDLLSNLLSLARSLTQAKGRLEDLLLTLENNQDNQSYSKEIILNLLHHRVELELPDKITRKWLRHGDSEIRINAATSLLPETEDFLIEELERLGESSSNTDSSRKLAAMNTIVQELCLLHGKRVLSYISNQICLSKRLFVKNIWFNQLNQYFENPGYESALLELLYAKNLDAPSFEALAPRILYQLQRHGSALSIQELTPLLAKPKLPEHIKEEIIRLREFLSFEFGIPQDPRSRLKEN